MIRLCWDLVQFWLDFGSIDRTIELFKGSIEPPNLIELSSSTELELELERFDLSLTPVILVLFMQLFNRSSLLRAAAPLSWVSSFIPRASYIYHKQAG